MWEATGVSLPREGGRNGRDARCPSAPPGWRLSQLARRQDGAGTIFAERLEQKVFKHDEQINLVLQTALPPIQGVFYNGQLWDARVLVLSLVSRAKRSLTLIDNWAMRKCFHCENVASSQFQFPMRKVV